MQYIMKENFEIWRTAYGNVESLAGLPPVQ